MKSSLENLDAKQQAVVRDRVRSLLQSSDAFGALDPAQRRELANGLVNTVAYLADPKAGQSAPMAQALATKSGAEKTADRLAKKQDIVQEDFKASAAREGADVFSELVDAVDFPDFVAGLIDGVFNSIVRASIQQMEAYGELLAQVVKSVGEFAKDNFTLNQGRDWLVGRFPSSLQLNSSGETPKVESTDSGEDSALGEVKAALGMEGDIDLSDEDAEIGLAQRAQLEMARLRQKQLATMVLMGINRIIVTDGLINAKILIDVKTEDIASRTATASMHDEKSKNRQHGHRGGWGSTSYDHNQEKHRTIVSSAVDDTSESKAKTKAQLSGEVKVNFRSDVFPLDRLASQTEIDSVNERAQQ